MNEVRLSKASYVPVYVYRGVADIGIAGKDTLLEEGLPLYEMLDLKCGKCKICVAGYPHQKERITSNITRVATKYPRIAKMYYDEKGEGIEIIKLNGSIELAPILDLSDVIVDIVESGTTIRENGLTVLERGMRYQRTSRSQPSEPENEGGKDTAADREDEESIGGYAICCLYFPHRKQKK